MKKKDFAFLAVIGVLLLLILIQGAFGSATLQKNFIGGINTWDWDGQVINGTLTSGSATYNVPTGLDPDMCLFSYDDQASITLPISWVFSEGSVIDGCAGVITIAGDSGELYTGIIYDFRGF
jgi:hypothetical protein